MGVAFRFLASKRRQAIVSVALNAWLALQQGVQGGGSDDGTYAQHWVGVHRLDEGHRELLHARATSARGAERTTDRVMLKREVRSAGDP
ncbi:MAG: hypothetical protein ABI629_00590 [bacterium]